MKTILLAFLGIISSQQAFAEEAITDVLANRSATYEQRLSVASLLAQNDKQQPLEVTAAIAELCYEVDLCAGLTPESKYSGSCEDDSGDDPEFGDNCYPKFFKKKYSCNPDIEKQSLSSVMIAGSLLNDLGTTYGSYIMSHLVDGFSSKLNVDFRKLLNDPKAMENYLNLNPKETAWIEKTANESLALAAYTLNCYSSLNQILFSKDTQKIKRYYNLYSAIINTMAVFPEYKGKVNRGTSLPKAVLEKHHKVGNVVCYDGFTSTAIHDPKSDLTGTPRNGFLAPKCNQRFYITTGLNAPAGKSISSGSTSKLENEVLFEPGACFRIDKVYPRTDIPSKDDDLEEECEEGERYNFEMTLVQ